MVGESGLIIAPYAVGAPDQGLTGEELTATLEALLQGAKTQVVAYDSSNPGRLSVVVTGLNPVEISPAVGDTLTVTGPVEVQLRENGTQWQLTILAVDQAGLLAQRMDQAPYAAWPAVQ
jgi:hypothetical protein